MAMSGGLRAHRALRGVIGIGLLSLAGVPPLVGFVSKEYVIRAAEEGLGHQPAAGAWVVLLALFVTVALTAGYCARAWLVLTHSPEPPSQLEASGEAAVVAPGHAHQPIDAPARWSVLALAGLSAVGGLIVLTPLVDVAGGFNVMFVLLSLLLIAGAAAGVRQWSAGTTSGDAAERLGASRTALFDRGLGADEVYLRLVARPVTWLARVVVTADRDVIDAYVRGSAVATGWAGAGAERAHTRKPSAYLVWVLFGMLAVAVAGVGLW